MEIVCCLSAVLMLVLVVWYEARLDALVRDRNAWREKFWRVVCVRRWLPMPAENPSEAGHDVCRGGESPLASKESRRPFEES